MKKPNYVQLLKSAFTDAGKVAEYYSYFHNYSFGNQLLLLLQGVRSPVAPFKRWTAMGRNVKSGAKAKEIYVPVKWECEEIDAESGDIKKVQKQTFILRSCVFEAIDTDGEEMYFPEKSLPKLDKSKILTSLCIQEKPWARPEGNAQGVANTFLSTISINPLAVYPEKTFLHEVAHCLLHKRDSDTFNHDLRIPQNIREVEAESVAFITGSYLGILSEDAKKASRGYIQHWINNGSIPDKNARRIFGAVDKIIKALDPRQESK